MALSWPGLPAADAGPLAADELRLHWFPEYDDDPRPRRVRVDALLREVLAPLLGLSPAQLVFGREARGRPFLRHPGAPDFNLSDTRGGTLVAACGSGRVGADLERIDRRPPVHRLAARYFTAGEQAQLQGLPEEQARLAFLHLWTAKEASCKATGTGIFGYLDRWQFDAALAAPRLQAAPEDAGDRQRWRFERLAPSAAHTAVLALRDGAGLHITAARWPRPPPGRGLAA